MKINYILSICLVITGLLMMPGIAFCDDPAHEKSDEKPLSLMGEVAEDMLLEPGVGLGRAKFGDTIQQVEEIMGRGELTPQPTGFDGVQTIQLDYPQKGVLFQFNNSRLTIITVNSPGYATKDGIQVGVDVGEVIRFLGTNYQMKRSLLDHSPTEEESYELFYELVSVKVRGRLVEEIRIRTKKTFK